MSSVLGGGAWRARLVPLGGVVRPHAKRVHHVLPDPCVHIMLREEGWVPEEVFNCTLDATQSIRNLQSETFDCGPTGDPNVPRAGGGLGHRIPSKVVSQ